jgi:nitrate reductase alpha subunit
LTAVKFVVSEVNQNPITSYFYKNSDLWRRQKMSKQQIFIAIAAAFFAGIVSANTVDISSMCPSKCAVVKYLNQAHSQEQAY